MWKMNCRKYQEVSRNIKKYQEISGRVGRWKKSFPILYRCSKADRLKDFLWGAVDDGVEWAVGVDGDGFVAGKRVVHCAGVDGVGFVVEQV